MIRWDEENGALVDYTGMPLSHTEVKELRERIKQHLRKTPEDLAKIANVAYAKSMPSMHRDEPLPASDFV